MKRIGASNNRDIYYLNVRNNSEWESQLPSDNWCALIIVGAEDEWLIDEVVKRCLDNKVCYICSSGELAGETELAFDTEIVRRVIDEENSSGIPADYEIVPLTTVHNDLNEGLWFAVAVATTGDDEIDKVVCINVTNESLFKELTAYFNDINNG